MSLKATSQSSGYDPYVIVMQHVATEQDCVIRANHRSADSCMHDAHYDVMKCISIIKIDHIAVNCCSSQIPVAPECRNG